MADGTHYDDLETRTPEAREAALFSALPHQIAHAKASAPGWAGILGDVEPGGVIDRAALARLPVTRKSDLIALQKAAPPFGGLAATAVGDLAYVFMSPGPIFDPESRRADFWRLARAMHAAGFRAGDLVHNSFSYHFTPAGAFADSAARALGCAVFPAGVGQTELQVQAIAALRPAAYVGTPSFLKTILEKGRELGADLSSLARALVSAEALPDSLRAAISALGVEALQCYASADLGLIAYESPAREGMILDESVILEIVRPGTGDPLPDGEIGEVVITSFNPDYPLIRFATGDLSAVMAGASPCGRTNVRIKGWMGRADQATKVRGMFVQPAQIAELLARHPEITRARLVVSGDASGDVMTLHCETALAGGELDTGKGGLVAAIAESLQAICKLRGVVRLSAPDSLARDGKVIEDTRRYD